MNQIGHNQPPSMIDTAAEVTSDLSSFLSENPTIETLKQSKEAKQWLDRTKLLFKDMEDERQTKVRPLNEQVAEINLSYKGPRTILEKVSQELAQRLSSFIRQEELRRIEAANAARRIAEEAERAAREAERIEQESIRDASSGVCDVDIKAVVVEADAAFREYEKAARAAAIAEKEQKVKITGGFSRALSLRKKEELLVTDCFAAIKEIGITKDVLEAVIKSARAYRRIHGRLPQGVIAEYETGI